MLKLVHVSKTYSGHQQEVKAVDDVSLTIEARQAVAVQGPSGCGKTTLLLICGGLLHPTTGNILIDDTDLYALSPNQRSIFRANNIGFVFQQFHLVPYLNVLQNVLTANVASKRPDGRKRAEELIAQFHLESRVHHVPAELSVGEKQRVALARALFNEPKLVLADEPTGNLDVKNAKIVLDALRGYAENGSAVLIVTHDPAAAGEAHRVVPLESGRLARADMPVASG
ncbi:MAG: ABC transporter ATP-binding protein [Planctomycetota bacterium]